MHSSLFRHWSLVATESREILKQCEYEHSENNDIAPCKVALITGKRSPCHIQLLATQSQNFLGLQLVCDGTL